LVIGIRGLFVHGFDSYDGIVSAFGSLAVTVLGIATLVAALESGGAAFQVRSGVLGQFLGGSNATIVFEVKNAGAASALGDVTIKLAHGEMIAVQHVAPFGTHPVGVADLTVGQNGRRTFIGMAFAPPGTDAAGASLQVKPLRGKPAKSDLDGDTMAIIQSKVQWA